jgi:hypothetical protein
MNLYNDEYTRGLRTKLNFYRNLLGMINKTNDMFDIAMIESTIDFAFPGNKLDISLLETLTLEIQITLKEIETYSNLDSNEKKVIRSNQLETLKTKAEGIKEFEKRLDIQKALIDIDRRVIGEFLNTAHFLDTKQFPDATNSNRITYGVIEEYVDINVKVLKQDLKGKRD